MTGEPYGICITGQTPVEFAVSIAMLYCALVFLAALLDKLLMAAWRSLKGKRKRRMLYRYRRRRFEFNGWRWRNLREAAEDMYCDPTSTYARHNMERALESLDEVA